MPPDPLPEPTRERRIASHPDDPDAPLADRLLLALGMWPDYVDQLGVDAVLDATVMLRSDAHRYPMVCEDYGAVADHRDRLQEALEHIRDLSVSDAHLALTIASEALGEERTEPTMPKELGLGACELCWDQTFLESRWKAESQVECYIRLLRENEGKPGHVP